MTSAGVGSPACGVAAPAFSGFSTAILDCYASYEGFTIASPQNDHGLTRWRLQMASTDGLMLSRTDPGHLSMRSCSRHLYFQWAGPTRWLSHLADTGRSLKGSRCSGAKRGREPGNSDLGQGGVAASRLKTFGSDVSGMLIRCDSLAKPLSPVPFARQLLKQRFARVISRYGCAASRWLLGTGLFMIRRTILRL